jgi:hypothetical protein
VVTKTSPHAAQVFEFFLPKNSFLHSREQKHSLELTNAGDLTISLPQQEQETATGFRFATPAHLREQYTVDFVGFVVN